ncbi:hypothetical protein FPQ18DRAFT_336266 [Pyronema domesticum]|nr:hypothetical protein FPQ18DRAFT_336266 [Pyronema domesticum]
MLIIEAVVSRAKYYLEYYIPQKKREEKLHELYKFALAKPYFASYAATFLFFAFIPILGFTIFVISLAVILAATAAFWLGVALTVVAGFLMVSATLATFTYAYLVALFTAGQWARATFLQSKQGSENSGEVGKPEPEPEVKPEIKEEPVSAVPENEQPEVQPVETSEEEEEEEEDEEDEGEEEDEDEEEENAYQDPETPRSREGEGFEEVKRDELHDAGRELTESEKMRRDIEKSLR